MRGVEAALIALIVAFTVASAYSIAFTTPPACPRCSVDASNVAAWVTMWSANQSDVERLAAEANATLTPRPGDYTAPVAVWVNATPKLYTVGWRP